MYLCNLKKSISLIDIQKYMLEIKKPHLSFVAEFNPDSEKLIHEHNEGKMPILPLRDNALFPGTIIPITVEQIVLRLSRWPKRQTE